MEKIEEERDNLYQGLRWPRILRKLSRPTA